MIINKETPIHKGSHLLKIFKKGSWYFLSSILTKVMAILVWPITTRLLSENDIGVLDSLYSIREFLPILISLCLDEAYYRFYFKYKDNDKDIKKFVSTYFWIIFFWGIVVFALSTVFGFFILKDLFKVTFFPFIPLTLVGPLFLQLSILGGVYLKQKLKSEIFSAIEVITYIIFYGVFLYLLINTNLGAASKVYGWFISDLFSVIVFSLIMIKANLIGFKFDKKILIEGLKYSIPLIPNQASFWITGLSDKIILGIYKTFSSTGIYSIGYKLGETLRMFSESTFKVYKPIMFSMFTDDREEAVKRLERFIPSFIFIMFWLSFSIALFSKDAVMLLTDPKFYTAWIVTPIVVYAYFFGAVYKPFYHILSFYKKTLIISIGALIQALSNFVFNLIFIPMFDRIAAAYTTMFSYIVFLIWLFMWSQKYEKIKINWKKIILIFTIGILTLFSYILFIKFISLSTFSLYIFKFINNYINIKFLSTVVVIKRLLYISISVLSKIPFIVAGIFISIKLKLIDIEFLRIKNKK